MFDNKGINEIPPEIDYATYWETRDGALIKYTDMTDTHLLNSYFMLERQICDFVNRCMNRNEEYELPDYVQQRVDALEAELKRRGLKKHRRIK